MSAEHFDAFYSAASSEANARDEIVHRHLGLPIEIRSTSLLGMTGLLEVRDLLDLSADATLLDVACGRGGYGLWLARATGARLIGIDFSPVAIELAESNVARFGLATDRVEFRIGCLEATGLPDVSVDALLCVDAIQFAESIDGAAAEFCRVLRPGRPAVVTSWEANDPDDPVLPVRARRVHLARQLANGGFKDVRVVEKSDWLKIEQDMWAEAIGIDADDDPALQALKAEAREVLPSYARRRRVLATAMA